jgi:protein-tyrosine phosphatase/membrane-associated phospholipid phosphatase
MGDFYRLAGASHQRIVRAALYSGGLSLLFLVLYGGCSWVTSLRSDVGSLYFAWERQIPLIPLLIIPYMSIDLFFVGAPFLFKQKEELQRFGKRIAFVIVTGCCFFLIMPLEYAFPREVPDSWLGPVFQFLYSFDRPYNLFPSLHIGLRTLLALAYAKHARGTVLRWSLHIWFSLIGFSTVFTHQHHIVDIIGGFILAIIAFALFQGEGCRRATNYRVGTIYGVMAMSLFALSFPAWPLGIVFWWPATSLLVLSGAYFGFVRTVYRKKGGRLTPCTRLLHAFPLLGQNLSLLYYSKQADPWNQVAADLFIGRCLDNSEAEELKQLGIASVLDLTTEFSESDKLISTEYQNIPVLDLTAPTREQLDQGVSFIKNSRKNGGVYVHCKIGYSRTVAMIGASLLADGTAKTATEAIELIRRARPAVVVRPEVLTSLQQYCKSQYQGEGE